jgi:chromosome segregation ATPase
MGLM